MTKHTAFAPVPRTGRGPTTTKPTRSGSYPKKIQSSGLVHIIETVFDVTQLIQADEIVLDTVVFGTHLTLQADKVTINNIWQSGEYNAQQALGLSGCGEVVVKNALLVGNNNDQVTVGAGCGTVDFINATIYPGPNLYQAPGNPHTVHKDACDIGLVDLLRYTNCDVTGTMNSAIWGKATFQAAADAAMKAFEAHGCRFSCRRVGDDTHRNPHIIYLGSQCKTAIIAACEFDALPMTALRAVRGVTDFTITDSVYYSSSPDHKQGDPVEISWVNVPY